MARSIIADTDYQTWLDEWDWRDWTARSTTRWGSGNNYDGGDTFESGDLRLTYNPGQGVDECAFHLMMRRFRAVMGFRALVLSARWRIKKGSTGTGIFDTRVHEFLKPFPDIAGGCGVVYKDTSESLRWYLDGYCPQYGFDISTNPVAQASLDQGAVNQNDFFNEYFELRDYFARQLLNNEDLWLDVFQISSSSTLWFGTSALQERMSLDVYYLFPVEMYPEAAVGGVPDFSRLLNIDNEPISLGAYKQGETGTPQRFFLKNFSRQTLSHVEVWDDYPEWTVPAADADNGGSGALAYVEPFESCVSQRWEIKFTSATDFEIKATSYLDNIESLHPQYDADSDWEGDTSTDFTSPDGSIKIPAAAWSGTPSTDDLFVFYTRGNTTDNTWPADSNDQVEMCDDDAGTPSGDWRPITAQRTILTAGVTIDATTKTFTVKRIDTTKWPVGGEVQISNASTIDQGNIQSVTATTIVVENLSITNNVYAADDLVATTLPFRGLAAATWGELAAASGASETNPDRIYIDDALTLGFTDGQDIFIQSNATPTLYETKTIDTVYSNYILLTEDLANDYAVGDICLEYGSGEAAFWLRVVASSTSDEELKEFRLNVDA